MQRCSVCNGRTIKGETGIRCMNSQCEGGAIAAAEEGVRCRCGTMMSYQGEDSWGQPNYRCISCGAIKRL